MTIGPGRTQRLARFAVFEADLHAGELRKQGRRITLQQQPFAILAALLERPGELVTREDLCARLWPAGVVVDFDQNLNKAVNKLREALGDSAETPRFIETLPRRGYRFLVPVSFPDAGGVGLAVPSPAVSPVAPEPEARPVTVPPTSASDAREGGSAAAARATGTQRARARSRIAATAVVVLAIVASAWLVLRYTGAGAPAGAERVMLAVLPFENMSGHPEQEYFSDGLTEEMIAQLSRLRPEKLGVIARTSAMVYKRRPKRVDEIGRELGVDFIVEGSVRRVDDRVRITAQLIQVRDQTHLWAEVYERPVSDTFTIQSDVARRIAASLTLTLLPGAGERVLSDPPTTSAAAWEQYLKGRFQWSRRTEESLRKGLDDFERAVALDPRYALGYVGLADSYNLLADFGAMRPSEALPSAKAAASKAIAIDPALAEAHASLGWVQLVYDRDFAGAERSLKRAIELNPGYASGHQWYAYYLKVRGRHDEALREALSARRLDPMSLTINSILAWHHYLARRYNDAERQCRAVIEMDPNFWRTYTYLGWTYLATGKRDQALEALRHANELFGPEPDRTAEYAHGLAVAERTSEARAALEGLQRPGAKYVSPYLIARIHVALGDADAAFRALTRALAEHDAKLVLLDVDPSLDPLRSDRRFAALRTRVGF
jgi:TolB-like protein/DNA-binding winged helix-turn-helix (wHTH) protein/tetratricopeptide (TPR) repeat protein